MKRKLSVVFVTLFIIAIIGGINTTSGSNLPPLIPLLFTQEQPAVQCEEILTPTTFTTSTTLPANIEDMWPPGVNLHFTVADFPGHVNHVEVNFTISDLGFFSYTEGHEHVGDLIATLTSPNGTQHILFHRTGVSAILEYGYNADVVGPYTFSDRAEGNWWATAENLYLVASGTIPAGSYRTAAPGNGAITSMDSTFDCEKANGVWTLNISDNGFSAATAAVTDVSLVLE